MEDGGTTWNKKMVEVHQTQELVQLTLGTGLGTLLDHSNLGELGHFRAGGGRRWWRGRGHGWIGEG